MGADLDTTSAAGKRVAVIGGGPAGLTAAKCLLDEGHRPVVFEATDRPGGIWTYRTDRPGGTYLSTRLQTSKYTSHFSDFPFPDAAADFPDTDEINRYLLAYADRFGVRPLIRLNSPVSGVRPVAEGWEVTTDSHTERFDAVAVCTGLLWKPVRPTGVGEDTFPGRVLHSAEYHEPTLFAGKNAVIVGSGVSGADLAADAADVAKSVTWAVRTKRWIIPRVWGFVPGDTQVTPVGVITGRGAGRDETLRRWKAILPEYMAAYERSGLLPDTDPGAGALQVNDRVVGLAAAGKVRVSPGFERFDGPDVVFSDGTRARADVVVFATGYDLAGLPPLHPALALTDEGIGLYERVFHPDLPNFGVIGWFGTGLSSFPTMELQSRWFARVLAGRAEVPPPDEMRRRLAADIHQREQRIPAAFGRRFVVNSPLYNVQLAEAIGAYPDPRRDWRAYWEHLQLPGF
ncbi:MAG: flavin-containing monooxygenase, partial [Fimbriiglobus sp.]